MKKWLLCILGLWVVFSSFSQGNLIWPESSDDLVTNSNASIAIQLSAFSNITLEGYESVPEEAYIGVFFENGVNSYGCGGFSQWSNNNFVIAAFGDDPTTPNLQDGFTGGESYIWFLRINNSEDSLDGWTDYIGTNVEMESNEYFTPTWQTNGLSNLLSADFILYAEWSNCMDISACNYNQATNISDVESCEYCFEDNCEIYPSDIFDCDGNCWDTDNDGICNINELEGCTDPSADFLYDPLATEDDGSCMYQGCLDSQAQNYALDPDSDFYNPLVNVQGPCTYPTYEFDWSISQSDPSSTAVFAIADVIGLPDYESFCTDVNVGVFYSNNPYLFNSTAVVGGQLYNQIGVNEIIGDDYITFSSNLLENQLPFGYSGYAGPLLEIVETDVQWINSYSTYYTTEFSTSFSLGFQGYGNGGYYSCIEGQPYSLMTIYPDDLVESPDKDGFDAFEPMLFIVELDGIEYLAEPIFQVLTFPDGEQTLETINFIGNGMYVADLQIIGPVSEQFGCTDENYLEYNDQASIYDGTCVTLIVEGCLDPVAVNFNPSANVSDTCLYYGCTDDAYLEYWNYDPIDYSISELTNIATICDDSDEDGICDECVTLVVEGCTDVTAFNYESNVNVNDGSCIEVVEGCTDETMFNYNPSANTDYDGSLCVPYTYGCTNYLADNYNPLSNTDDGTCYFEPGCTNPEALNYNEDADFDDGTCIAIVEGCTDETMFNYDPQANVNNGSCIPFIYGCMDFTMWNYNSNANTDDGSCIPYSYGCTDPTAWNFDSEANTDDDSCVPYIFGCMDSEACNYDSSINTPDGSCWYADVYYDCDGVCISDEDLDGVCDELEITGCMDSEAFNYDSTATDDDGSCIDVVEGCMNETAYNYNSLANTDDESCCFVMGCTDNTMFNYNSSACYDDGSCTPFIYGCTNPSMWNFDTEANIDDGSCIPYIYGCTDDTMFNYDPLANTDFDGVLCIEFIEGCTDETAFNYEINANTDDGSCIDVVEGCTDETASNYDPLANTDDGSCVAFIYGCTDETAANYNPVANIDNNTCFYLIFGCTNPNAYNYDCATGNTNVPCNDGVNINDGSCIAITEGCTDDTAYNYDPEANTDDGSCEEIVFGCTNSYYFNFNSDANTDDGSCIPFIYGCTDDGSDPDYNDDGLPAFNYDELANYDFGGLLCVDVVEGCTDETAYNYNVEANTDDESCIYIIEGCTDETALNYNPEANTDDGSCIDVVEGCMESTALNYNPLANIDDESCCFISGCTNPSALNYDQTVCFDDGSCCFISGCTDPSAFNYDSTACYDDGTCVPFVFGCDDDGNQEWSPYPGQPASNYDPLANESIEGLLCTYIIEGCTDPTMFNYNPEATDDDGSCIPFIFGCTDPEAFNYNELANTDFGGLFCEPVVLGCTNPFSLNYDCSSELNPDSTTPCSDDVNTDDGSCILLVFGCMDETASNYNPLANEDFGGVFCEYPVYGCTDTVACNFNILADTDDESCFFALENQDCDGNCLTGYTLVEGVCVTVIEGCTDPTAFNYDIEANANTDDGSCIPIIEGCTDPTAFNYDIEANANTDDGSCIPVVEGCTDNTMWNYNIEANTDDGSCIPVIMGCTDPTAFNYDIEANANTDDGSCVPVVEGCMYPIAINYNPNANTEDGSCEFGGCTNPEAENYCCGEDSGYFGLDDTFTDDGSCIIYGCTIEAWYICPESYNPDATINDWSDCTFIWEGCATTAIELPSPGEYPTLLLSDVTDNIVDAYFYLGDERIGCMDQLAVNYLKSAVLDDGSCFYLTNDTNQILEDCSLRVYPQPAKRHITIEISLENKIIESELVIYNILGEILYTNKVQQSEIINIDVEKWTVGIYYVMVKMKNKNLTYKFTVE